MNKTLEEGHKIHFDLTYIDHIDDVLDNIGEYANTITGSELRYIRDNRLKFKNSIKFYKKINGIYVEVNVP